MNQPSSDQNLVNFLKQNRPNLPEAAPDLEQRILAAIANERGSIVNENHRKKTQLTAPLKLDRRLKIASISKWVLSSAIFAGLVFFGSGYRVFETAQLPDDETAHLEAFLIGNWEGVLPDSHGENTSDRPQIDWLNFPVSPDSEPPTNN